MYSFDLKSFRKKNNLSQSDMAAFFGCGQSFISLIETDRSKIPDEYISKLLANPEFNTESIVQSEGESYDVNRIDVLLRIASNQAEMLTKQTEMLRLKDIQIDKLTALLENQLSERKK